MVWFTWLFSINSVASARNAKRSTDSVERRVEHRSSFLALFCVRFPDDDDDDG